jgi:hypothetical protein
MEEQHQCHHADPRGQSPPPPLLCQAIPRWQELTPQLQSNLLTQLTLLLLQHLGHAVPGGTEVDDDNA